MAKYEKTKIFLLGMIAAFLIVYLIKDNHTVAQIAKSEVGRYQLCRGFYEVEFEPGTRSIEREALVRIDTETGQVSRYWYIYNSETSVIQDGWMPMGN